MKGFIRNLNNFAFELLVNKKPSPVMDNTAVFLRKMLAKLKIISTNMHLF